MYFYCGSEHPLAAESASSVCSPESVVVLFANVHVGYPLMSLSLHICNCSFPSGVEHSTYGKSRAALPHIRLVACPCGGPPRGRGGGKKAPQPPPPPPSPPPLPKAIIRISRSS